MKGLAFRFATVAAVSTGKDDYPHFDEIAEFVAKVMQRLTIDL
jgi:hypothetical protein